MPRPQRFQPARGDRRGRGKHKPFRRGETPRDWHSRRDEKGDGGDSRERLQKVLAAAGVGSRRDCEELIRDGRVEVDKQVVTEMGTKVDPLKQEIRVDGEALKKPERMYFAVNKPEGVVSTNFDPSGRQRVIDLVPTDARLFAVGRLDRSSEGLILLTNDGEFANRLTHPRYGVAKSYLVRVAGQPSPEDLAKLRRGVHLAEGVARVDRIIVKGKHKQSTDMVIVLREGRNREIRRILARVGHKVLRLRRIGVGRLKLGDLPLGAWRKLAPQEVAGLLAESREQKREGRERGEFRGPRLEVRGEMSGVVGQRSGEKVIREAPTDDELQASPEMPELGGDEEDADFELSGTAEPSDEMVEITESLGDETAESLEPGEILDYGEEESGGLEGFGSDDEVAVETPPAGRNERQASGPRRERGKSGFRKPGGKPQRRPLGGKGRRKFADRAEGERTFAARETGEREPGRPGKKFRPRAGDQQGQGRAAGGGKSGRKFGKPAGKYAGKPTGKFGGKFRGGKKRFGKGKGRP